MCKVDPKKKQKTVPRDYYIARALMAGDYESALNVVSGKPCKPLGVIEREAKKRAKKKGKL